MGCLNSYFIRCCVSSNNCPENHCKIKIHSSRSFTFNKIADEDNNLDSPMIENTNYTSAGLVNINSASEDVLMTLPGVNRNIAHDVICHRKRIGRFKNIEDIALVNGIGADKFKLMKSEISVQPDGCYKINEVFINQIDIFQLTKISGLTQTLAERIINYREKKGPFKSINELLRIPGVSKTLLRSLSSHIRFEIEKLNQNGKSKGSMDDYEYKSTESLIEFKTPIEIYFKFILNVWKFDSLKEWTLRESEEKCFSDVLPTMIVIVYEDSSESSIDIINKTLNKKHGPDCFICLECNAGASCIHNNEKSKMKILSNFHKLSGSMSLCFLHEDNLSIMIISIHTGNQLIYCVALFQCAPPDHRNESEELLVLNDLANRLNSDYGNYFVFLCDLSLIKLVHTVFQKNGLDFDSELIERNVIQECVVTSLWKQSQFDHIVPLRVDESTVQTVNDIFIQKFDVTVPLS